MEATLQEAGFSCCNRVSERDRPALMNLKSQADSKRDRRFFWLLVIIWLVNCFDLELTLLAAQQRMLWEMNPVAQTILPCGPRALMLYKFGLLVFGTLVLWRFRSHRLAVTGIWGVAIACVIVSILWYQLYFGAEPGWGGITTACTVVPSPY